MPLFTPELEFSDDYPTIEPSLKLDFANARALDPRITFTRASTATYVGRDGLIKTAGEDEARFDHDPTTGESLGLLIEDGVTNLIPHSQDLNAATWNKYFGSSVSANYAIAPDGTQTADRIIFDGTSAGQVTHNLSGLTIGKQYAFSAWVKSDGTSNNSCLLYVGGTSVQIIPTNEWQRIYVIRTATGTNENPLFLCGSANSLLVWGVQYEEGPFPTSYIPTSGASAARTKDVARILGASFSEWYQHDQGTFLVDTSENVAIPSGAGYNRFFQLNDVANGNQTNTIQFIWNNGPSTIGYALWASGTIRNGFGSSPVNNEGQKVAFAYTSADDNIAVLNGSLLGETISNAYVHPATFTVMSIGSDTGGNALPVRTIFRRVVYYPKRLTNAQLQTLTQ